MIIASLVLLLFTASEVLIAIPIAAWLYVVVAAMFAAGLLRLRPPRQQRGRLVAFSAVCFVMAGLYLVPWCSRTHFLRRLYSVKPGMSVRDVRRVMAGYMEGTGVPANPMDESKRFSDSDGQLLIPDCLVFRHSDDPAYNADWGMIYFRAGRVAKVEFSAD